MNEPLFELKRYRTAGGRVPYGDWISEFDETTAARIRTYVYRMASGNFGRSEPVGDGVFELKIDFGPGFRVYYLRDGMSVVILLAGGDKSTQTSDIRNARAYAEDYRSRP